MDADSHSGTGPARPRGSSRGSSRGPRVVVLAVLLTAVLGAGVALGRPDVLGPVGVRLPWATTADAADRCAPTPVTLVVAPELIRLVQDVVDDADGSRLPDGRCLRVDVRGEAPSDTVRDATAQPAQQAPQLWIPDSSIWTGRVRGWPLQRAGGFGTSPVVFATSQAAVDRLGWGTSPPSWAATLSGSLPVAIPRLVDNAAGISALLTLYQGLGRNARAEKAVAGAVLVSQRTQAPTAQAAIEAAARNAPDAPLFLTSELTVFSTNRGQARPQLVAVYPRGGTPTLDYPILRVAPAQQSPATAAGVQAVVEALTSEAARAAARRSGLRESVEVRAAAARRTGSTAAPVLPPRAQLLLFLRRLDALTIPSRLLTVVDVSLSMNQPVPGTPLTRVQLAGAAAARAGELLADDTAVGLWVFAADMGGGKPYQELVPVRLLATANGTGTHRDVVNRELAGMPRRLSPGGTALYDTVLAAVSALRANYDPAAINTVVLFTDGRNEARSGLTLNRLVNRLETDARTNRDKPVQVVGIGLGPSADVDALTRIARATNGSSHRANTPQELEGVLFDALARRSR